MYDDFVNYEQAKTLKKLGFNLQCNHFYCQPKGKELKLIGYIPMDFLDSLYYDFNNPATWSDHNENTVSAPTLSQAQKWIREQYNIDIYIDRSFSFIKSYHYEIVINQNYDEMIQQESIQNRTYEQALSDAIDKVLLILNDKKS